MKNRSGLSAALPPKPSDKAAPASGVGEGDRVAASAAVQTSEEGAEAGYSVLRRLAAGLAAWAVPGGGYAVLGQVRRAWVVGLSIGALYVIGLLVGGVTVTNPAFEAGPNSQQFLYWFQACLMPSHVLRLWQDVILSSPSYPGGADSLIPESATWFSPSLGRVREVGVLYLALSGLLNVLAIVDALLGKEPARGAVKAGVAS